MRLKSSSSSIGVDTTLAKSPHMAMVCSQAAGNKNKRGDEDERGDNQALNVVQAVMVSMVCQTSLQKLKLESRLGV